MEQLQQENEALQRNLELIQVESPRTTFIDLRATGLAGEESEPDPYVVALEGLAEARRLLYLTTDVAEARGLLDKMMLRARDARTASWTW
jgi:hypothetical protein